MGKVCIEAYSKLVLYTLIVAIFWKLIAFILTLTHTIWFMW